MKELLRKWVLQLADKYSSRPDKERVFESLTELQHEILNGNEKKGLLIQFDSTSQNFIIFSDQHKGKKNHADDFMNCEKSYLAALDYYLQKDFTYINLGDGEELWENKLPPVIKMNPLSFELEKQFVQKRKFIKIYGNHDLFWGMDPLAGLKLKEIYGENIPIYEGCLLQSTVNNKTLDIFLTHGHQGDKQSDGNWFSKFFVSKIWEPMQSFLDINPNTPATNNQLKTLHNKLMYEWSSQQHNKILITGHTHQPVFMSLTHIENIYARLNKAKAENDVATVEQLEKQLDQKLQQGEKLEDFTAIHPSYFNSGCCCFSDGDITGIEISENYFRLVSWKCKSVKPERIVLDEVELQKLETMLL